MLFFAGTVFDEAVSSGGTWYSSSEFDDDMAGDLIAMLASVTDLSGTAGLIVDAQHSADGQNWDRIGGAAAALVINAGSVTNNTNYYGSVSFAVTTLRFIRLKVTTSGTGTFRVKIAVTSRNY